MLVLSVVMKLRCASKGLGVFVLPLLYIRFCWYRILYIRERQAVYSAALESYLATKADTWAAID